ncbi:MAG: nucleoside hydrolase [Phycisphaera sp.]|nr:nucleoside hydrolase [Phycisphaera sp.]
MRQAAVFVFMTLAVASLHAAEPLRVIFDTDMDSDCDDAGALAMLHAMADRREVTILATPVSATHRWSAPCTDAINTYFGRPDIPIGVPKGKGPREQGSKYAKAIAESFPHDCPEYADAPDATAVYRRVLAAQPDGSVVIITVGDLTNLRYLLESKPDDLSPLAGPDLVRAKVSRWVCMGSRYPADLDPAPWGNFKPDPESSAKAIAGWPTLVTFIGGGAFAKSMSTGARLAELPADNPVRRVYELYFGGKAKDRHSADQLTVLIAVRGTDAPWQLVTEGHNHIFPNGTHEWRTTPDNPLHQYISALQPGVDPHAVADTMEGLMMYLPGSREAK